MTTDAVYEIRLNPEGANNEMQSKPFVQYVF